MHRTLSTTLLLLALSLLTGCVHLMQNHLGPYDAYGTECYVHKPGVINYLMAGPSAELQNFIDDRIDKRGIRLKKTDFEQLETCVFPEKSQGTFQFVHLSDVQIRDRAVSVRGQGIADCFIPSACHNFYQDHADAFYFGHILTAIRKGVEQDKFDAVVHTGDAVDLGIASEFWTYNYLVDTLLTDPRQSWLYAPFPFKKHSSVFLDLIGNHDYLFMGNFKYFINEQLKVRYQGDAIAKLDGTLGTLNRLVTNRLPRWRGSYGLPAGLGRGANINLEANRGGYYCVDRPWAFREGQQGQVRLIVLNTYEAVAREVAAWFLEGEKGAKYPSISERQKEWLKGLLDEAKSNPRIKAVLVFGHCQLAEITVLSNQDAEEADRRGGGDDRAGIRRRRNDTFLDVAALLGQHRKVVAYFCGHLHSGSPRIDWPPKDEDIRESMFKKMRQSPSVTPSKKRDTKAPLFYEFIVPSIQEYPKCFSVVTLTYVDGEVQVEVQVEVKYRNLQDLYPSKSSLSEDDVRDIKHGTLKALREWREALAKACGPHDRAKRTRLLAEYAFLGARADVRRNGSESITGNFNPALRTKLKTIYGVAANFREFMVNKLQSPDCPPNPWTRFKEKLEEPGLGLIRVDP